MSDRYAAYERLKIDYPAERVLRIRMSNPGKLNSADATMHRELVEIWRDVDADPDVNVAILTGDGDAFSAGGDFGMIERIMDDYETKLTTWKEARDIVYNVINCGKTTIAAFNGPAVGAGLAAGMCCDITIAGRGAKLIDGHTRLGVAAGDHAVIIWPLLMGMAKAKYYLLTCDPLTGEEAERLGLVSLCVDDDKVQDEALAVAAKLAGGAQTAIRFTKYALNGWLRAMGPQFDVSLGLEFLGWDGPEPREGLAAHKEKRKPKFPPGSPV